MKYIKVAEYTVLEINQNGIFYTSWTAPKWTRGKKKYFQTNNNPNLGKKS
jgi:hypothetical protein